MCCVIWLVDVMPIFRQKAEALRHRFFRLVFGSGWVDSWTRRMLSTVVRRLRSPELLPQQVLGKSGLGGETHDKTRPSPVPGLGPRAPSRIGMRDPVLHSPAAFVPPPAERQPFCNIPWYANSATPDPDVAAAGAQFRRTIHDDATWHPGSTTRTQSYLSNLRDARTLETLMQQAPQVDRISLEFHQVPWAGAWLGRPDSPLFDWGTDFARTALQHRLRVPFLAQDSQCPSCGQVLACFCDHAATCPRAGDHNRRQRGGPRLLRSRPGRLCPQKENAGLLQPRPDTDGLLQRGGFDRIADVWIPHGKDMIPEARLRGHLLPPPRGPEPWPDDHVTEPDRMRELQEHVPRHSQPMPPERHPLDPRGFRRTYQRVGRLCSQPPAPGSLSASAPPLAP